MRKQQVVNQVLADLNWGNTSNPATAFAPANIALAKYWGKRDAELHLPMNSSLSISLAHKGAHATIAAVEQQHELIINAKPCDLNSQHGKRLTDFLDLFSDPNQQYYQLTLEVNLPFAAGLASSACVFAAIVLALNRFYNWQLNNCSLSILARLGSGSASRSIEHGFIEWNMGKQSHGMDSYATKLAVSWPEFTIGLCIFNQQEKKMSSSIGMQRTVDTSPDYSDWPASANQAVMTLRQAIHEKNFSLLGKTAEQNSIHMHQTMQTAKPPIIYSQTETDTLKNRVWQLRKEGIEIYFTQDAGPNLKLIFLDDAHDIVCEHFQSMETIKPFQYKEVQ